MNTKLIPERLTTIRKNLGLNMAQTARLLNLSKMGYGRYEHGDRSPSYQTLEFIAEKLGTSVAYLTGASDSPEPEKIVLSRQDSPELYSLVVELKQRDSGFIERMLYYYNELNKEME